MASPFERILQQFKAKLTPEDQHEFGATTLRELELTIAAIQKKQASTRTMQNLTRLQGFLEAMQTYSVILDLFVNVHNFVAFVWGPVKLLLLTASTFADAFNALLDSYQRITENLPNLAHYQSLFGTSPRMQQALETVFEDIFEFHFRALKYFKGNVWKQLFQATWKQFDTKFKGLLSDMGHHKHLVETQASLIEFQEARHARERATKAFDEQERHEILRRKTHLKSWLSAADARSDQARGVAARQGHPQSGRWLLRQDTFRTWHDPQTASSPLLWINGIPGAGKSVLASLIVEDVTSLQGANVLYFYFRHDDSQRNSFLAMARSLLLQTLSLEPSLVTYLFETAAASEDVSLSTGKVAEQLLDVCLKGVSNAYLVIDGLDECPEHEQRHIATWLRKYIDSSASLSQPSRCVFLSQDDRVTRSLLSKLPTLRISSKDIEKDIEAFCVSRASQIQTKFTIGDVDKQRVVSTTADMAQGMFLFAKLVMSNLHDQTSRGNLFAELSPDVFPQGLGAAYGRIISRILDQAPPSEESDARRLLAWLVCAARSLNWREIQAAVSINSDLQTLDYEQHRLVVDAKHLCGSLIEECPDGQVTLVHSTAKFFLVDSGYVKPATEHLKLAELCLEYMCFPFFDSGILSFDQHVKDGSYALLEYALLNWTKHMEHALSLQSQVDTKQLKETAETLESFFVTHWKPAAKKSRPSRSMIDAATHMDDPELRENLLQSMASMHALVSAVVVDFKPVVTTDLFDTLFQIRERIEKFAAEHNEPSKLHCYYGPRLFKCQRIYCKWFHEGFETESQRQAHVRKHERSHYCKFAGCAQATLGFATKRELDEHVTDFHKPQPTNDDFPDEDQSEEKPKRRKNHSGQHVCPTCNKGFSKASNLRAHERTHIVKPSERPFACSYCDKRFARNVDKTRHEALHSGEKQFACLRPSHTGADLGCGRRFARHDQLSRHLSSKTGQACRQAMLDDEAARAAKLLPPLAHVHRDTTNIFGLSPQHINLIRNKDSVDGSSTYYNPLARPNLPTVITHDPPMRQELGTVDTAMLLNSLSASGRRAESPLDDASLDSVGPSPHSNGSQSASSKTEPN